MSPFSDDSTQACQECLRRLEKKNIKQPLSNAYK